MSTAGDHALDLLRAYVEKVGSARKVAWQTGIGPERISRWLNGKEVFSPTLTTLEKMAEAMGVTVSTLLGGTEPAVSGEERVIINVVSLSRSKSPMMRLGAVRKHLEAPANWLAMDNPNLKEPGRVWVVSIGPEGPYEMQRAIPVNSMLVVDRGPGAQGISADVLHQGAICVLSFEGGFRILRTWWDEQERMLVYQGDNPTLPSTAQVIPTGDINEIVWGQVVRISANVLPKVDIRPQLVRVVT